MFERWPKMGLPFLTRKVNIALLSRLVAFHIVIKTRAAFYKKCNISRFFYMSFSYMHRAANEI